MFSDKKKLLDYGLVLALIVIGVAFRFLPHAPNFTPVLALVIFGAAYLPKKFAFLIPLGVMFISDFFLGSYQFSLMFFVYGSLLLLAGLGFYLKKNDDWKSIGLTSLLGASLFFLTTNFGVWALTPWYEKTLTGLMRAYYLALPFFRNTMVSTLVYSSALFFSYKSVKKWLHEKKFVLTFNRNVSNDN